MSDPSRSFASPRHSSADRSASGPGLAEQDRDRKGVPPAAVPAGLPSRSAPGSPGAPTNDIWRSGGRLDRGRGAVIAGGGDLKKKGREKAVRGPREYAPVQMTTEGGRARQTAVSRVRSR